MYQLSVICPSIRPQNLYRLYCSISSAFSGSFEFIVISPYELPKELEEKDNVQYIQSFRSPIACQQIGLVASRGELISWVADDGVCIVGSYDIAVKSLENEPYTTIVTGKYFEGNDPNGVMGGDAYYTLWNHESMQLPGVPKECLMLNCGVVSRALLMELGGWESGIFQVCPMSYNDFAIRAHKYGCKFILQNEVMFTCSHMPGITGDHAPIHNAQTDYDTPMFTGIYSTPSTYLLRQTIDVNNWRKSPSKWAERFGE